jgi:hypothetical protein
MIGLSSPPSSIPNLLVGQTKIDFRAAQAFIADLYLNAGLELPETFDPVQEIIKVVSALREQGKTTEEPQ